MHYLDCVKINDQNLVMETTKKINKIGKINKPA